MRGAIAKTWKGDEDVTCAAAQTWSVKAVQLVGMRQNHERQNPAIVMHFLFFHIHYWWVAALGHPGKVPLSLVCDQQKNYPH